MAVILAGLALIPPLAFRKDVKHGLGELAKLSIDLEANKGIQVGVHCTPVYHSSHTAARSQFYHPLRYYTVEKPAGVDYIGEIEVETGKCIHGTPSPGLLSELMHFATNASAPPGLALPQPVRFAPRSARAPSSFIPSTRGRAARAGPYLPSASRLPTLITERRDV